MHRLETNRTSYYWGFFKAALCGEIVSLNWSLKKAIALWPAGHMLGNLNQKTYLSFLMKSIYQIKIEVFATPMTVTYLLIL